MDPAQPEQEIPLMAEYQVSPNVVATTPDQAAERIGGFLRSVYGWMSVGLAITALTATAVAGSPAIIVAIAKNSLLFWGLIIAQFGIVIALSGRVDRMAASTASALFIAYSVLTGMTMSFILLAYTGESVASTFVVTAGMFGALAAFGTVT